MNKKKLYYILIMILGLMLCCSCTKKTTDTSSFDEKENLSVMENEGSEDTSCEKNDLPEYTKIYPDLYVSSEISKIEEDGKKIAYLSFDDGPSKYTSDVLKILKENDIKATFFILGSTMTKEGEECLKTMVKEGHTIGLHTYSHKCKSIYSSVEAYLEDFDKVFQQVYGITGIKPIIFRFPCGSVNCYSKGIKKALIAEMERRGFTYYDWNVTAEDSVGTPTEYSIITNVKHYCEHNKPVILMHDSSINKLTTKVLPKIISKIKESGYEFDTLDKRMPCHFRK